MKSGWIAAFSIGLHAMASAAPNVQAAFVPQDIEICPAKANVLDPEFDSKSGLMVFMDAQQRVRVTSLLPDGMVGAAGCAGTVVDQGSWGWPGSKSGYNGPEWGRSQRGLEIFFLKPMADGQTPALARAWANGSGWQSEYITGGDRRSTLLASTDDVDPQARLMYLYQMKVPLWRESTDPSTEAAYPAAFDSKTGSAPRWIPGQRAISLTKVDSAGITQAARYFIDTKAPPEFLTTDGGTKSEVWMWSAPEFGGDLVFTTIVDGCCLRVYRQTGSTWTLINSINAPAFSTRTSIFSPEPRVVRGRSYVALQVGNDLYDPLSEIWLTTIDPGSPNVRKISDPNVSAVRTEPEWFVSTQGAFIYYTQAAEKGVTLHRASTGLQPQ